MRLRRNIMPCAPNPLRRTGALSSAIEPLLTRPGYPVKGDIIANLLQNTKCRFDLGLLCKKLLQINGLQRKDGLSLASLTVTRPRIKLNQVDRFRRKPDIADRDGGRTI